MRKVLTSMSGTYNNAPVPPRASGLSPSRLSRRGWASACPQPPGRSRIACCTREEERHRHRHRQRALSATAGRRHDAELARDAQHVERNPQHAHATVAILVKVDTAELPAAAGGRETTRLTTLPRDHVGRADVCPTNRVKPRVPCA